jgi:RNA polymerase nonessential primary-like sigma factor
MQQPPTQDDLRSYLKEIGSIPLLSTEEEITLGKAVHQWQELEARIAPHLAVYPLWAALELEEIGPDEYDLASKAGKRAKDKMVRSNLRLVVSIAKKYKDRGMELLDLIEEGNLGLIRGVEKFDPYRGFKFSTYAFWWIKQAITRAIGEKTRNIRLPIHITEKLNKRKKVCRLLSIELNRSPTVQEIVDRMEMPLAQYQKLCEVGQKIASLDMVVREDATLGEFLPADEQEQTLARSSEQHSGICPDYPAIKPRSSATGLAFTMGWPDRSETSEHCSIYRGNGCAKSKPRHCSNFGRSCGDPVGTIGNCWVSVV